MHAVITGGTKGIGRAVAERLAEPGARLIVNYHRDEEAAAATVAALSQRGAWARAVRADACSLEGAHELAAVAREELDGVHGLVHCAVWTTTSPAMEIAPEAFREAIERNASSLLWLAQAFRPQLGQGSSVVFISSAGSSQAVPGYVAVGVAKAMGESLVRYLAAELAEAGIRVNTISSGPVDTEALRAVAPAADEILAAARAKSPSRKDLLPAEVAGAVALLLSADASMIQGDVIHVDGGLRLAF